MLTPLSHAPTFRRSDVPTLRLRFPALRPAEPSQTSSCLLTSISLYNLCTLMDSFGLYSLLASCSLHIIRYCQAKLADLYIDLDLQWDPHSFLFGSPARYVASCSLLLCNRLTLDPLPVAEPACRFRPPLRPQLPLQK